MDRLINALTKLAIFKNDFDYHLIRASMVIICFSFGYQEWFQYEAVALIPSVSQRAAPVVKSTSPTTSGSRSCRDCASDLTKSVDVLRTKWVTK